MESGKGRHPKFLSLMQDENFRKAARKFILENGYAKGKPNLTLQNVVEWVKAEYDVSVCTSTISIWLHDMGFKYSNFSKGVYFDGHEREDVVADRTAYLGAMKTFESWMCKFGSPCPNPTSRPVVCVFHDESTFYTNGDQTFHWTDGTKQVLKQKSLGQAIMVSD